MRIHPNSVRPSFSFLHKVASVFIFTILLFFRQPAAAHAGWGFGVGFGGGWHHHSRFSVDFPIVLGADRYYYYDQPVIPSYVYVAPPVGSIVYAIPVGCHPLVINGYLYYEYSGVYYIPINGGYQVVPPPVVVQNIPVAQAQTVVTATPTSGAGLASDSTESLTVNVPNSQGGYTAVTLQRSGKGFIGPQGEFYPEFPKVEQLRVMYAK